MAGAGSNWLSGVNVVLVMAYGSLVSRAPASGGVPRGRARGARHAPVRPAVGRPGASPVERLALSWVRAVGSRHLAGGEGL